MHFYRGLGKRASSPSSNKHSDKFISLRASSPGRSGGRQEKEGELATTSLGIEFCLQLPCSFPSTELSDLLQSARIGNERECKQTLKNTRIHVPIVTTLFLVSSPPISISHRLFRCGYSFSRDV